MPLPKSPYPARIGPQRLSDWYRGCEKAVQIQKSLAKRGTESDVLVLGDAQYVGARHENEYYVEALTALGARRIRDVRKCYETVGQIVEAQEMAKVERKGLIVISTWLHYLRVCWLLRRSPWVEHIGVWGIPHWRYAIADLILTVVFPIVDLIPGGRDRFLRYAEKKRKEGKYD